MVDKILRFLPILILFDLFKWSIAILQIPHSYLRTLFVKPKIFQINDFLDHHKFIFIYASIEQKIGESSLNILTTVRDLGGYIILVTNNSEYIFDDGVKLVCDVFIDNKNTGWDFAEYKQASYYVYKNLEKANFSKVIYANDSVFYLPHNLKVQLYKMLDEDCDVVSVFDGAGTRNYHFGSWFVSISKHIFLDEVIRNFWSKFFEVKNKFYTVIRGEFGFSKSLLALLPKTHVIYNGLYICDLKELSLKNLQYMSPRVHDDFFKQRSITYGNNDSNQDPLRDYISHNLGKYALPQVLGPLLIKYCEMPFIKKDLFWNEFQSLSSIYFICSVLKEKVSEEYLNHIKAYYLKRGFISGAKYHIKILYFLGVR